jgi:hypothetical protein
MVGLNRDLNNNIAKGIFFKQDQPELYELMLDRIRKQVEKCSNLQGFVFQLSSGGATGGGLGAGSLLEEVTQRYKGADVLSLPIGYGYHNSPMEAMNDAVSFKHLK